MNKWMKKLTAALCAAVLMCGMAVTAYAGGGDMGYPAKSEDFVGRGGATEQSECSPQGGRSGAKFVTTRDGLAPVEPLPAETIEPSEGFTEDGNLVTRDLLYADADKTVLVMDNLNTHTTASLYKAFPPEEAYRIAQKLEIHYTPKHGSWLDMAEIELSALTVQCLLNVRIPTIEDLNKILSAWSQKRNFAQKGVSWHFTTDDARIKLSHLYPEIKF